MSNLLNKKSLYDLKKRNVEGNNISVFNSLDGPNQPSYNRDFRGAGPNESPFSFDSSKPYPGSDHLVALLENTISSNRKGDGSTVYLSTVFGASEPSSFRPEDLDLEGQSLYPNYGGGPLGGSQFGTPGSDYKNAQLAIDPDSKF